MIVSNSNIKTYQKCPMKFYFAVKLNLKPKEYSVPMERGTFGHKLFEVAFTILKDGGTLEEIREACNAVVELEIQENPHPFDNISIYKHVMAFVEYFMTMPWRIVELEAFDTYEISDGISFGFTPDLVIEWLEGPKKGSLSVLDYKFTGKYWNERQLATAQQMIKYMIYWNKKNKQKIRHAGVVMLNTRAGVDATGNKLFLIKWFSVTKQKLATVERENEILVKKIEAFIRMTAQEYLETEAIRTVDEYECMSCPFADDLCPYMLEGRETKHAIAANYEVNDYGYN